MSTELRTGALQAPRDPAELDGLSLAHAVRLWAAFAAISLGGPLQSAIPIEFESTRTLWREARKASTP